MYSIAGLTKAFTVKNLVAEKIAWFGSFEVEMLKVVRKRLDASSSNIFRARSVMVSIGFSFNSIPKIEPCCYSLQMWVYIVLGTTKHDFIDPGRE